MSQNPARADSPESHPRGARFQIPLTPSVQPASPRHSTDLRTLLTGAASLALARGISLVTLLALIPYMVRYLSPVVFGGWITVASAVALLDFADFGIGEALVNPLTDSLNVDSLSQARVQVSTNAYTLGAIGALVLAVLAIGLQTLPWRDWLSVGGPHSGLIWGIAIVQVIAFSTSLALRTAGYVRLAQRRIGRSAVCSAIGALTSAAATFVAIAARSSALTVITMAALGPMLGNAIATADLLVTEPSLRPALRLVDLELAGSFVRSGVLFTVQSLSGLIAYSVDTVVIGNALGPAAVAEYSITSRVPLAIGALIQSAVIPLWPMMRRRHLDGSGTSQALLLSLALFGIPSAAAGVVFLFTASPLIHFLGANRVPVSHDLVLGLSAWLILGTCGTVLGHSLVATGRLRAQAVIAPTMAALNLPLSVMLVRQIGVAGAIWGTVISYGIVVIPCSAWILGPDCAPDR